MFDKPFALDIITPERTVLSTQAVSVSAPGVEGGFQVLFQHAPLLSALEIGRVSVRSADGTEQVYATSGGVLEVRDNKVLLLLETAERPAGYRRAAGGSRTGSCATTVWPTGRPIWTSSGHKHRCIGH